MPLTEPVINAFEDQVEVLATMDVGKMWDRLRGEFLGEWERLQRQGLPDDEIARALDAFMSNLSDTPEKDLARQSSTVAHNQGRGASMVGAAAEFAVRSEVLDTNTCRTCDSLDGMVVEVGTAEFHEFMPPAKCEGGDRCRGFYIAMQGAG